MQNVKIYGCSDDLVEVEGIRGENEFTYKEGMYFSIAGKILIFPFYAFNNVNGCWMFAVSQVDEEIDLPEEWNIKIVQSRKPYSTELRLTVPDGVGLLVHNP